MRVHGCQWLYGVGFVCVFYYSSSLSKGLHIWEIPHHPVMGDRRQTKAEVDGEAVLEVLGLAC